MAANEGAPVPAPQQSGTIQTGGLQQVSSPGVRKVQFSSISHKSSGGSSGPSSQVSSERIGSVVRGGSAVARVCSAEWAAVVGRRSTATGGPRVGYRGTLGSMNAAADLVVATRSSMRGGVNYGDAYTGTMVARYLSSRVSHDVLMQEYGIGMEDEQAEDSMAEEETKPGLCSSVPWYLWPLLVSIDTIGPFSTDAYQPNVIDIKEEFGTNTIMVNLTLQLNMVVSALSCVFVGSMADQCGRRTMLIFTMVVYVAGAVLCAVSWNIWVLIAARILMGVGQGSQVLAQVIARDLVRDAQVRLRVMATLGSLQPLVVVLAPTVGGFVGSGLGWRWVFWLQVVWGAIAGLGSGIIKDTSDDDDDDECGVKPSSSRARKSPARRLLGSRLYVGSVVLFGLLFGTVSAMLTLLPFVTQEYYKMSVAATGSIMGVVPLFIIAGATLSMVLNGKYETMTIMRGVMVPYLVVALGTGAMTWGWNMTPKIGIPLSQWWPILIPCFLMIGINGIFVPICQTLYLQGFPDIAGSAAGAAGFTQSMMMAGGSAVASAAWNGTPSSFYLTLAILMLVAQVWFWLTLGTNPPKDAFEARKVVLGLEESDDEDEGSSTEESSSDDN